MAKTPRREMGRTLIDTAPDQLVWILSARESRTEADRAADDGKVDHQLSDLRKFVGNIGGRIAKEVPEANVSSFKRKRVLLPDGTYGYRVVRPDWESILTSLRRGEANALACVDLDRATRDPRLLEDVIDAVELYGVYVVSMTGNIDLSTDHGISAARSTVNQRNDESRNTSRRVAVGKRKAAAKGKNHGGPNRSYGWRKDRVTLHKRESAHILAAVPRIIAGALTPLTLAKEWNDRKIPTVKGGEWRAATIRNMFLRPRMCGKVVYREEILMDENNEPVRGQWEPMMTDSQWDAVVAQWTPVNSDKSDRTRLGSRGTGFRTNTLLSPFVRCGKCKARMIGSRRPSSQGEMAKYYLCPSKGQGGCGGVARLAAPVDEYITALVIADQERMASHKVEDLPPWPRRKELDDLEARINESTRRYEAGKYRAERYFPSLSRMESDLAVLRREHREYETQREGIKTVVANLAQEWEKPAFTMEQRQAAIARSLTAVIIAPVGKGKKFNPEQITPVWREIR
ncbi:recombinase family protein [Lentzea albidocapillata]|uniref:Site-specific DNA recombinase n=1 Tax=Lentzea albidocapillata TaxID=40571 RepID=A0A1W2CYH2_9PSEU|nr:recombinase family protein [Lentzea albidocapillata]SMC90253.1 Site-specific DNA recombinase [Lentzea albidocapillata]